MHGDCCPAVGLLSGSRAASHRRPGRGWEPGIPGSDEAPPYDGRRIASAKCVALPPPEKNKKRTPDHPIWPSNIHTSSHAAPSRTPTPLGLVHSHHHDLVPPSQFHPLFCTLAHLQFTHAQPNINSTRRQRALLDYTPYAVSRVHAVLALKAVSPAGAAPLSPPLSLSLAHAPALCFVVRFRCVRSSSPSSQEPPSRGASKCTSSANRPSHPSRRAVPALSSSCHVTHIPLRTGKDIHELTSSSASLLRYLSHPPAQLCFSYLPPTTTAPVDLTSSTSTRTPHAASDVATHLSP